MKVKHTLPELSVPITFEIVGIFVVFAIIQQHCTELTALRVQFWHGDVAEKTFDGARTVIHSDRLKTGWPHVFAKKNEGEQ